MFGSGREALRDVREWPRGPPEYLGVVGRPSQMSGSGRKALTNAWELSGGTIGYPGVVGGPLKCPGVVGWPS